MSYTKAVIEYFNNEDLREQEDLVNQIESGAYEAELSGIKGKVIDELVEAINDNSDLSVAQLEILKKINHIGAKIILAHHLED